MTPAPELIETAHVTLRRATPQDELALFHAAHDLEVMRYMDWPMPRNSTETAVHLQKVARHWSDGTEFQWVIVERQAAALVGTISCRPRGHAADFGYFLARAWWGRGYAGEAAAAVVAWLAGQPEIVRIWATSDVDNLRSRRLLERIGLKLEGVLRMATVRPNLGGPPRDTVVYARCRGDPA